MKKVVLKPGKEKPLHQRHHWIFSGAIKDLPSFEDGEVMSVYSSEGEHLGSAYFNRKAKIIGRMLAFDKKSPEEAIKKQLDEAIALRRSFFQEKNTTAFRLVNGEGDLLPGLIVDKYGEVLVLQFSTVGMEKWKAWIVDYLVSALHPKCIFEKSNLPSRKEEGLGISQGLLYGQELTGEVEILENNLRFLVDIAQGQKTGFFLDHREMRKWIKELSANKRVLNCFSYTGGFSVYAAAGGASKIDSVDISSSAVQLAERNMSLNGFDKAGFFAEDVFEFLRQKQLEYDVVILDPPAFAKKQKDVIPACRGYKDINRLAMQKMPAHSLLLTSSCSYHVNEALFQTVVFQAAVEAGRTVRIIGRHRMAIDHPINICHPESDYLKSLLLYLE